MDLFTMSSVSDARISILTITQLSRYSCLLILYDLIKSQTYENILEWVIVEGSQNEIDGVKNKRNIQNIIDINNDRMDFNIVYIDYSNQKLSDLRNLGNDSCNGDIIVCMDDDDYYPKERVEHAVESLEKSTYLIAGCSDIYLYDFSLKKVFKSIRFSSFHSTNNVMAYRREYLRNHRHSSGLTMSEEASFTNNFSEPMVQLKSIKSIIVSSHSGNTVEKQSLCLPSLSGKISCFYEIKKDISHFIPFDIFCKMRTNFTL
jgi:glycosyltransferase involved in cell wall biosynthesis